MTEFYYRYRETASINGHSYIDATGDLKHVPGSVLGASIWLEKYPVLRRTPKGVWIRIDTRDRFICDNWERKWAHPTIAEAAFSYRIRKASQVRKLKNQLKVAEDALEQIHLDRLPTEPSSEYFDLEGLE